MQLMFFDNLRSELIDLEHIAVLDQNDVVVIISWHMMCDKFLLPKQHSIFPVNRDDVFGLDALDHYLDVFLRSVAGHVNQSAFFFDDVGSTFVEMADQPA